MKDKRLVIKLKNNTAGALDSVIRKYSAYIYTVVYNVLSGKMTEEDIEETVSDAFIKLWQNSGNLREDKPLLPYLSVIALNLARNRLRENKSYAFCDNSILEAVQGDDFFEKIEKSETVNMVLEAAENCLKEQDREIFIRYYFYGERLEKISAFLGLTLSNSKTKLCRARKKIREYLTERGTALKRSKAFIMDYRLLEYKKIRKYTIRKSVRDKLKRMKGEVKIMKMSKLRKLAVAGAIAAATLISFTTVNAATDGAVINKITDTITNVRFIVDGREVEKTAVVKEKGEDYIIYEMK